jgi:DNA-binding SARP family transcriptional activator
MARLAMSLLGPLEVRLDGAPVSGFESNRVRALLAYLAVEADRPHHRQVLAGLLWPDWPNRTARTYLRNALSNLRHVIGDHGATPPFLLIAPRTLQFNTASDYWLDVTAFEGKVGTAHAATPARQQLGHAVALYHGDFLEGFALKDSPAFEDWSLMIRERLQRHILTALSQLAGYYEGRGEYARAADCAWRQVELAPWQEEGHQQLMRLLALGGQRSAALAQYETCRRLLREELGVDPAAETTALFEGIKAGTLAISIRAPSPSPELPAFLKEVLKEPASDRPVFVARQRELARLDGYLAAILGGHGRVVFVTGGAGRGKTALIEEFARRAQGDHPDLVVAEGNCSAYSGIGDPYLPFRHILELLTGEVEARYAAGAISRQQAGRLWQLIPGAIEAILADGRDLVETFLPGGALLRRAAAFAHWSGKTDWLPRLEELVERKTSVPAGPSLHQSALFEQYSRVLRALVGQRPFLLVLDDLQWADPGSCSLLFHLSRGLEGSRILLVGAYRPDEVAAGIPFFPREAEGIGARAARRPLEAVVNELKRHFGEIELDLGQAEGRPFIDALLDSEPNRLGSGFRATLYRQTRGHPLFTVELLRGMQERGDLVRDEQGRWIRGPALDWDILPPRVEAAIAERVGQLPERLREVLSVASVQGEFFNAEVIAQVVKVAEGEMVHWLSGELEADIAW